MSVYLAEFLGTAILILLGGGVVAGVTLTKSKAFNGGWIVITFGWGMAVAMAVYTVGTVSGAHLNPAVTLGLASIGDFDWALVPGYMAAQLVGAFTGAVLVYLAYLPHWKETGDPATKLGVFSTAPAVRNPVANIITEVIGTAMLVLGVLGIGANSGHVTQGDVDLSGLFSTGIAPLLVGLLVLAIGLSLGGPTGYAINPARDLGPRLAHAVLPIPGKGSSDWSYAWIPVVAPLIGGVLGAWVWRLTGFGG
ncbi:MIP/aquaporin family protein [Nocardiopsis changdeensis]|uniref:Aquaporin family protein n=1 Tax=Nocardiopsis changdeensis TaxID=2831969 RepID=A0ABX8BSX7_9ACTN|nr:MULTISPECIES: MIP/aquaporin family protein [Nocardiopsis]QUX23931.1 aquaporin family protein [Nocardiopsis changdeensis]QYX39877.1 aquaporin family protein [Nocardiopsis sp. MT53]